MSHSDFFEVHPLIELAVVWVLNALFVVPAAWMVLRHFLRDR